MKTANFFAGISMALASMIGVFKVESTAARTPTTGQRNVLVIFAKFKGEAPNDTLAPAYAQDIFNPNLPGSLSHFYLSMSSGKLTVRGKVLEKIYFSDHGRSYYKAGEYGKFNEEILRKVDADVDFGEFDNNGPDGIPNSGDDDGYVDFIFINLMSVSGDFMFGGPDGVAELGFDDDDFQTEDPAANSGYIKIRGDENSAGVGGTTQETRGFSHAVGLMAHEFAHTLGLPDLYDLSYPKPEEDSGGIGKWGLMGRGALGWNGDDGPNPFCAWSLEQLGWVEVVEVRTNMYNVRIEGLETSHRIYKIPVDIPGFRTDEYFLIANRQSSVGYYDRNIPGSGLLISHIYPTRENKKKKRANDIEVQKTVDIECADGLRDEAGEGNPYTGRDDLDFWAHDDDYMISHNGNWGDATDVFDGDRYTSFTPYTNPNSNAYVGPSRAPFQKKETHIAVINIHPDPNDPTVMVADFILNYSSGQIKKDVRGPTAVESRTWGQIKNMFK